MFSWGGNPGVGSLHRLRDAVGNNWPVPLELGHSHTGMANRYAAGASHLPFAILRGYIGTDLEPRTNVAKVTCPFTGEELTAVPAMRPDVGIVHAQRADRAGNVQLWGIVGIQKEIVLGSERSLVTVEEIVDELEPRPGAIVIPRWAVTAVAAGAARRASLLRARLLRPRQRLLPGLGPDRAQPRHVPGLDGGARPMEHSADEMMTVAAARELRDGEVCFVGIELPSTAANLARGMHAPDVVLIYESGTIGSKPTKLPLSIGDGDTGRDRRLRRVGAGDLQLLAAGRADPRRLPRGGADRPPGQPQLDGDRLLRRAEGAAAGGRRGAGDRWPRRSA